MKIVLIKQYQIHSPGVELDVHKPIAELLIGRKIAREVLIVKKKARRTNVARTI